MSLLQGLLGFGAGAAGAFAEQKKADIEAQRQANLDRLRAQYQGQIEKEKEDETTALILEAQAGSTAAQARLAARDVTWQAKAPERTAMQKDASAIAISEGLQPGTPEYAAREGELLRQMRLKPGQTINVGDQGSGMFNEIDVAQYEQIVQRANQARVIKTDARIAKEALESETFRTGAFGEERAQLGRIGRLVGLNTEELPILGSPATAEVLESTTSKLTQATLTSILEGTNIRGSTVIFENIQRSMPNLAYTPEGNKILADIIELKADYDLDVFNKLMEYRQKYADAPNPLFPPGEQNFYAWQQEYNEEYLNRVTNYLNISAKDTKTPEEIAKDVFNINVYIPTLDPITSEEDFISQLNEKNVKIGGTYRTSDGVVRRRNY